MKTMNTIDNKLVKRRLSRFNLLVLILLFFVFSAKGQVPVYSSYPSATAVIFLDFDGHTVDATVWNYDGPIVCGPSTLSSSQITEVYNRVAEDYRPFNLNVTTDSTKYLAAPADKRMRVILTVTSEWYGAAGGVAFNGSFQWSDGTPCFVFTALLNNNVKNISEAASHESGHTLGLYHQATYDTNCVKVSDYNYGIGSGEIGWAPIMGVGYYRNLTLWNFGPNSYGCNNNQSDLDIIVSNGFGFRTDDYGNSFSTSSLVPFVSNQFVFSGVIEKNTDQDMVKFTIPVKGRFQLNALPYSVGASNAGSNLDMQVSLYSSTETLLNVFNPATVLNSFADTVLDAGTYYLKVEGKGNMYAPNYASLGSYSVQGSYTGGVLPLHRLELKGAVNGDKHQLNWVVEADEQIVKQVLEYSTDGRSFEQLHQPLPADRYFSYQPLDKGTIQYRLKVIFDNGHEYYSNIVSLRADNRQKPVLVTNLVTTGTLTVNSPDQYDYTVYDMNGRVLTKGLTGKGIVNIQLPFLQSGMYVVGFRKGNEPFSEKFIKK